MTTQNLIEIQSNLQDPVNVTMQDLIKYANGSNPQVPSYLALMEMNRRKQVEQTSQAFNQPQSRGTIKDQTVNALMNRPQVNPTAAPQGINPTASPQMVNPAMAPRQVNPSQMPQQVNPAAAPPMQAAEGGLMSIPVKHFKTQSFAGGGIVAFEEGGEAEYDPATATRRADYETERAAPSRPKYKLGGQEIDGPRSMEEILKGLPSISPMRGKRPEDMTPEQAYQRRKEIEKMAGVADDPFASVKKRQADIEARQAEEYKSNARDRLLATAEAFATADPAKGFGFAGAMGSKASRTLEGEQRAIRNKQEALNLDIEKQMAKEEDARRRGDAKGVQDALEKIKKDQDAHDKLQMEHEKLAQAQYKTASDIRSGDVQAGKMPLDIYSAETQRKNVDNIAESQRQNRELAELTRPTADDVTYNRLMGKANQDPEIKMLAAKLKDLEPGSDEYAQIQSMMYAKLKTIFAKNPDLLPPPPEATMPLAKKEKPGFWSSIFGSSSEPSGGSSAPRTVSFDQLPK